jgi:hypothetical protein
MQRGRLVGGVLESIMNCQRLRRQILRPRRQGGPAHQLRRIRFVDICRIAEKEGIEPDGTIAWFQRTFARGNWQNTLATPEELERILARGETWLKEGR